MDRGSLRLCLSLLSPSGFSCSLAQLHFRAVSPKTPHRPQTLAPSFSFQHLFLDPNSWLMGPLGPRGCCKVPPRTCQAAAESSGSGIGSGCTHRENVSGWVGHSLPVCKETLVVLCGPMCPRGVWKQRGRNSVGLFKHICAQVRGKICVCLSVCLFLLREGMP